VGVPPFLKVFIYGICTVAINIMLKIVLVHMGQVRDAFLMEVYLDVRNPRVMILECGVYE
jgi:hypothetical protein